MPHEGNPQAGSSDPRATNSAREIALVERARSGDQQAFADLYSEYRSDVFRYVLCRVGDPHLAEDLTSETFLRALRGIGAFRWTGRNIRAWLVTIAHNLLVDQYKCPRHRREVFAEDVVIRDSTGSLPSAEEHVLDAMQTRSDSSLVHRALVTLPPQWRGVVVLRYWSGWRDQVIAEHLGLPTAGAARVMRHRAMCKLRTNLTSPQRNRLP